MIKKMFVFFTFTKEERHLYSLLPDVGTVSEGAVSTHEKSLPQFYREKSFHNNFVSLLGNIIFYEHHNTFV